PMKGEDINMVFGEDTTPGVTSRGDAQAQKSKSSGAGQYFFYPAQLLFYPVRSNVRPFFYATSDALIRKYISCRADIGSEDRVMLEGQFGSLLGQGANREEPLVFDATAEKAFIDEYQNKDFKSVSPGASILPDGINIGQIALFHDADMTEICKRLPVIARNNLENGLSKNLWYEEVVPRESRFYFFVSRPEGLDLFEEALNRPEINHKVQIGGNASIGYGLCKLERTRA
ncbi:MAG: RAMP superfamily CRISPR-associated protein, partial [Bacteroidetes bacterium]|nr:RAMP superfamily CRISPR-associated protein [Bacteroidota bacterium]